MPSKLAPLTYASAQQWSVGPGDLSPDYPIPASVDLISCNQPLRDGNPKTTLSADPSSDTVLLMALGSMLHGSVRITTGKHDSVRFSVALESLGQEKDTIVCSLKRGDGENGVGIFVSSSRVLSSVAIC